MPWKLAATTTLAAIAGAISAGTIVVEAVNRLVEALASLRRELEQLVEALPPEEERPPRRPT